MTGNIVSPTGKDIELRPVHPNAGIKAAYKRKLDKLIQEMQKSVVYHLRATYRREMGQDASPANVLQKLMKRLSKQWRDDFEERAQGLAQWFANKALGYSDSSMSQALKDSGFAVEFKMTREMQNAYSAVINEQVSLIKSIPADYMQEVEGMVMRSVQRGRDLGSLTDDLTKRYGITRRRAALIARDQNNKATAVITQVRQRELGITEAIWRHSGGGKEPRPSHVAANGKKYNIEQGMYLDGVWTWPGHEINCRCVSRSVIPALD